MRGLIPKSLANDLKFRLLSRHISSCGAGINAHWSYTQIMSAEKIKFCDHYLVSGDKIEIISVGNVFKIRITFNVMSYIGTAKIVSTEKKDRLGHISESVMIYPAIKNNPPFSAGGTIVMECRHSEILKLIPNLFTEFLRLPNQPHILPREIPKLIPILFTRQRIIEVVDNAVTHVYSSKKELIEDVASRVVGNLLQ